MFKKLILFIAAILTLNVTDAKAQKAIKPVKSALKDKKYSEAIKIIESLRKDSAWKNSPKLAIYAIDSYKGMNDAENLKLYLKKNYDTIAFFSTTLQIIKECVRLDSIEKAEAKDKYKRNKFITENIRRYFTNIPSGARYLYKKGKYAESLPYLEMSLELPKTKLGQETGIIIKSEANLAALHLTCAYNVKQYDRMMRYTDLALRDTVSRPYIMRCMALKGEVVGDTATYRQWLELGWKEFPRQNFFFIRLADFHLNAQNYLTVRKMAEKQLSNDSTCIAALLALCNATFHLEKLEECIETAQNLQHLDSLNAEAYFFEGASYVSLLNQIVTPDNINSTAYKKAIQTKRALAIKAELPLEKYQALAPEDQKRWAPLLYQVYLILNRGKKFGEIDTILQGVKPQWPTN